MRSVADSPFFKILLPSFLETWAGPSGGFKYRFYIGYDKGDRVYDSAASANEFKRIFQAMTKGYANLEVTSPNPYVFYLRCRPHPRPHPLPSPSPSPSPLSLPSPSPLLLGTIIVVREYKWSTIVGSISSDATGL